VARDSASLARREGCSLWRGSQRHSPGRKVARYGEGLSVARLAERFARCGEELGVARQAKRFARCGEELGVPRQVGINARYGER